MIYYVNFCNHFKFILNYGAITRKTVVYNIVWHKKRIKKKYLLNQTLRFIVEEQTFLFFAVKTKIRLYI